MNKIVDTDSMQSIGALTANLVNGFRKERQWDGLQITKNGVVANVPIEQYHKDTLLFDDFSISSSGLRKLLQRPAEYWWTSAYNPNAAEQESKKELNFGKAAHMLLLGEDCFAERYSLRPEKYEDDKGVWKPWSGNSNSCKAWLEKTEAAGKMVITQTEIDHIHFMRDALSTKWAIKQGIMNGRIERSIFFKDKDVWLKTRPDVIPNDSGDFVDLKTAASVDDESLSKAIFTNGYHVQAGLMRMVVREVLGADAFSSFTFVFVEKTAPYDVRVMQLKDADIDLGERQAMQGLKVLRDCLKRNEWPGYDGFSQNVGWVEMPSWARTRIDTELRMADAA